MNILWEPQFSSTDKQTGLLKVESDSNFVFALNLLKAFTQYADITMMMPRAYQLAADDSAFKLLRTAGVELLTSNFEISPAVARFFPSRINMGSALRNVDVDFIFCNDPMHVANWRQLTNVPIVTYNHWVCSLNAPKNNPLYAFRQVEGYYLADLVLCNSDAHLMMIQQQVRALCNRALGQKLISKVKTLPPSIDEDICAQPVGEMTSTILFNHRLSSFSEYAINRQRFFEVLTALRRDKLFECDVVVTNPSGYDVRALNLPEYVKVCSFSRDEYLQFLATRPITCAFYEQPRAWSMSLSEANALGSASVVPAHSAFLEMYPKTYSGLFREPSEARDMLKALIADQDERQLWGAEAQKYQLEHFSNKVLAQKLKEMIEEI